MDNNHKFIDLDKTIAPPNLIIKKIAKIEIKNNLVGWARFEFDANRTLIYWSGYYYQSESGIIDLSALRIQPNIQFTFKGNARYGYDAYSDEIYYYSPDATLVVKYELRGTSLNPHFIKISEYNLPTHRSSTEKNVILRGTKTVKVEDASRVYIGCDTESEVQKYILYANRKVIYETKDYITEKIKIINLSELSIPKGTQFVATIECLTRNENKICKSQKNSTRIIQYTPESQDVAVIVM